MATPSIKEGTRLWEPSNELMQAANITRFMKWLQNKRGLDFADYRQLWEWSVSDIEDFWSSIWEFFEIKASKPYTKVLSARKMPGARWFLDSELNFAEHVFRNISADRPALIFQSEIQPMMAVSWDELYSKVASVAASLRSMGVKQGDRIAAFLPNIPEAIITFLACASIGAVWSSCSPDFGKRSVIDRLNQIEPKVLFAADGYQYGGNPFDRRSLVSELQNSLVTLKNTVLIPYLQKDTGPQKLKDTMMWQDLLAEKAELVFEQVPFNHPMWVLYSSGTTGLPKALVHSQGGILIEFLKFLGLHVNIKPEDRFFWYSTTGWVMWNVLLGGLLTGATSLLYDGSPAYPNMDVLWEFAEKSGMTIFGTSAAYITACMNAGMEPGKDHDLSSLKAMGSTGSPLSPEGFAWVYERVKSDIWLASASGGTDPCTAFVGGCPVLPVCAGELQCRCLGVKAEAFDEGGAALVNQVGELVISEPMPSMPLFLWNDPENRRYRESYFEMYPGAWRHGDWIKISQKGSALITGRSDSTLNRMGVRFGSSEIYGVVEDLPQVNESLIVGLEPQTGGYYMPLFVVLKEGIALDETLKTKINQKIRSTLSPRHVPDDIFAISEVPKTLNAKKLEVPVKKILMGEPVEKAVNVDSMSNSHSINFFVELAQKLNPPKSN
jgi:acetoacetyl-CoA synthetase